jgi:hypothetical protein
MASDHSTTIVLATASNRSENITVMAVASYGGHLEQLLRLTPYLVNFRLTIVSTGEAANANHFIHDCNRRKPFNILACAAQLAGLIRREKPAVIVTTGAAPGLVAAAVARLYGIPAVWIDSVANAERLSLSGRLARYTGAVRLTQWRHLEGSGGPTYWGSIL